MTEFAEQGVAENLSLALLVPAQVITPIAHELDQPTPKVGISMIHAHSL
jgi:hypothetical protein